MRKTTGYNDKFFANGAMKYFPGNTILNMITDRAMLDDLESILNELKSLSFAEKFVFLPVSSLHMTIIGLMSIHDLNSEATQKCWKEIHTISEMDAYIASQLEGVNFPTDIVMQFEEFQANRMILKPKSKRDHDAIWSFRKEVSEATCVEFKEDYQFHISFSYLTETPTAENEREWEELREKLTARFKDKFLHVPINQPILGLFNDMSDFREYGYGRAGLGTYVEED